MDQLVERPRWRGALVELPVERRRSRDVGRVLPRAHVVVAVDLDVGDRAEPPLADEPVAGRRQMRSAPALRADLHDAPVLPGRCEHRLALGDVDADRLLEVDVGAGRGRFGHRQRVPVIRRADEDDVEVFLLQHLAVVLVGPRALLRGLPGRDQVCGLRHHHAVDVAQRDDLDRGDLNQPQKVGLPVPARADEADAFLHVGELLEIPRTAEQKSRPKRADASHRGCGCREKVASVHRLSLRWLTLGRSRTSTHQFGNTFTMMFL